jgi:hypothetical protein
MRGATKTYRRTDAALELHVCEIYTGERPIREPMFAGSETTDLAKYRMNAEDSRLRLRPLHYFRVTCLWTGCTRLIRRGLENREFD